MRKWMFGVLSGVILMLLTAAVPSSTIQGTLFPSIVSIHNGSEVKMINGTGDNGVINYNDKAYIPLRLFSEEMGASVGYEPASEATNGLHKIDIYQGVAPISWSLERTDLVFPPATDVCSAYNFPFYIIPTQFRSADGKPDLYNFNLKVHNLMADDISVKPIVLTFEVTDEATNQVIYSRPLPPISGVIPSKFGFNAVVSWDHTGLDGKVVPSGNYYINLKRPSEVSYKVLGSVEEKSASIYRGMGCNLGFFRITIGESGQDNGHQTEATNTNTGESDSVNVNLTVNEAKDILNRLIPKAVSFYGMFNGTGWFKVDKTKTIPGETGYAQVIDEKIHSIADLKKAVEEVITKDCAQIVFYSRYLAPDTRDRPLYKDYEGTLYNDTQNGGHGWARKFLIDTAKIKGQKGNVVEIALDTTSYDDPDGTLIIKIEYVNGKWLMASGLDDYVSVINGSVK